MKDFDEAIKLAPKDVNVYLISGNALLNREKLDGAIKIFSDLIRPRSQE